MGQRKNNTRELNMDQREKYQIIKNLVESKGNKNAAALRCGCTVRTINRLIQSFYDRGESAFIHGNTGRVPVNQKGLEDIVVKLFTGELYDGSNILHFCELLKKHENIEVSEGYVRTVLRKNLLLSPKAQKRTKKTLRKRLREEDKLRRIPTFQKEQLVRLEAEKHFPMSHPTRSRCKYMGEMLQVDASKHRWFGKMQSQLHLAIDDASGAIVGAYFDWEETLKGYYHMLKQVLETYGIPYKLRTDRRTVFTYQLKKNAGMKDDTFTQFGFACSQLGIDIESSSVPEFKGRVERSFQTLQSRLVIEMRLSGVSTLEQANEFVKEYIKTFNDTFAVINGIPSCFDRSPSSLQILHTLVVHDERTIDKGNCLTLNRTPYRPLDSNGKIKIIRSGTKVGIIKTLEGSFFCTFKDEILAIEPVPRNKSFSTVIDYECDRPSPKKKPYIPPPWHPWRNGSFQKYKSSRNRKVSGF
jgi:hypothetical protein